jgi:hypothetical protein
MEEFPIYTEVGFGLFLETVFAWAKAEHGIVFGHYPNPHVPWRDSDWLYQIVGGFSLRIFRWPSHEQRQEIIEGPYEGSNSQKSRKDFEARFENDFRAAVERLR